MAIAQVQKTSTHTAGSPISLAFANIPLEGNLLIATVTQFGTTITADPTVAGFTAVAAFPGSSARRVGILYKVAGGSESATVVATAGANASLSIFDLHIFEYSGTAKSYVLDQVANDGLNSAGSVTTITSGTTAATVQANELAIAVYGMAGSTSTPAYSNSFTSQVETNNMGTAHKILSAAGTQESTRTWATGRAAGAQIATFQAAPPPPPVGMRFGGTSRPAMFKPGNAR